MTKRELRQLFITKRRSIQANQLEELSEKIANSFFANLDLKRIKTIHVFLPISHNKEVNTFFIMEEINKKYPHIRLVVPKVIQDNDLENYLWTNDTELQPNKWGIPEPIGGKQILEQEIDLILLPLLAFDKQGHRVGYGKGFYDRFLSSCRPDAIKVGLSIEEPVEAISDVASWDIALTHCITPTTFWTFS